MKICAIAAISVDGYIARDEHHLTDWTSPADKAFFVQKTKEAGAVVMGANTYRTIGHALSGRRTIVYSHHPITEPNIEVTQESPAALVHRLETEGCHTLAVVGGRQVFTLFLQAGLIRRLYLTMEPIMFGKGVRLTTLNQVRHLRLHAAETLPGGAVLLTYDLPGQA